MSNKAISEYTEKTDIGGSDYILVQNGNVYYKQKTTVSNGGIYRTVTTIPNANVLLLATTDYDLIAAGGAGTYIEVLHAVVMRNGSAFSGGSAQLKLRYSTDAVGSYLFSSGASFMTTAGSTLTHELLRNSSVQAMVANDKVVVYVDPTDPSGSTATLVIDVMYRVLELP